MRNDQRIAYETARHYAIRTHQGYEIYRNGTTAAERCATIGFLGDEGFRRVIAEIQRREAP